MNLSQFTIGKACLSEAIYLGKLSKNGKTWLHKKDITQEFIKTMIDYVGENKIMDISDDKGKPLYEITVKKVKKA